MAGVVNQPALIDLARPIRRLLPTTTLTVARGGTGATSLTDGGVLLGSGAGAITATAVLTDGQMLVGDGTTDPALESGTTLRTSIGVGTGDSPTFTGLTLSGFEYLSMTTGITAGTTQSQAGSTALTTQTNRVTVSGSDGDGVKLPTAVANGLVTIINDDAAQTIKIWPNTSDTIDGGSANAVDGNTLAAGNSRTYLAYDATNWVTVTNAPSAAFDPDGAVTFNDSGANVDFRVEGENVANMIFVDGSEDAIAFGGARIDGAAHTFNNLQKRTMLSATGTQIHIPVQTTTFDNASETVAIGAGISIGTPSWGNDNATLTMTAAATLYIQDAPGVGSNVAMTNRYALLVDAGLTRLDGGVTFGDETLDEYDEGTWTPTLVTTGTQFDSVTYDSGRGGTYTRIGNKCFYQGFIRTDAIVHGSGSGNINIGGLPFTNAVTDGNSGLAPFTVTRCANWNGDVARGGYVNDNATTLALQYRTASNGDDALTQIADLGTGSDDNDMQIAGSFQIA
jgi:hypothetical protein